MTAPSLLSDRWKVKEAFGGLRLVHDDHMYLYIDSVEEAEEYLAYLLETNGRCIECNDIIYADFDVDTRESMRIKHVCFTCHFWLQQVARRDDPSVVRVGNVHYYICNESSRLRGFGGQRFHILFHDGRNIVTHNLWSQGTIPEHFRDRLPPNATFTE